MDEPTMRRVSIAAAMGAAAMYVLDPRLGRRRRRLLRDRTRALGRRGWRGGVRAERRTRSLLYGRVMAATHRHERLKSYDDVTLAHKVESQLYRDRRVPKGQLNVDACAGVVTLRGLVDDAATIERIVARVGGIQGVRGVDNLLHGTATPPRRPAARPSAQTR